VASATYSASFGTDGIVEAQQAEYVAFLFRTPFATDAFELGFTTGIREDYTLQIDRRNVGVPVTMLDNDFHDPDLDRYLDRFDRYEPDVAVLGDAESRPDARRFVDAAIDLRSNHPDATLIVVPKCAEALETLDDAPVTVGFPMGYSDVQATDFSDPADWRGLDVHLLGGSPTKQYETIQTLTQPTITAAPPANVVGLDWNGPVRVAYLGEHWSRDGWQCADHLDIRETVRRSLEEIRAFWRERGVWPGSTPKEEYGPAVQLPNDHVWAVDGHHITDQDALERAIIVEYDNGRTFAYRSEHERKRVEYQEGLIGKAVSSTA